MTRLRSFLLAENMATMSCYVPVNTKYVDRKLTSKKAVKDKNKTYPAKDSQANAPTETLK